MVLVLVLVLPSARQNTFLRSAKTRSLRRESLLTRELCPLQQSSPHSDCIVATEQDSRASLLDAEAIVWIRRRGRRR
jgi:hypothetical protein